MRNVNFAGTKFKKIEDEELNEKRKREQKLNQKRKLLKDEFTEKDQLEKHQTKQKELIYSLKGSTEFDFKKELDVQSEIRSSKQKQLEDLEKNLAQLVGNQNGNNQSVQGNHFLSNQDNAFATKSQFSARQFSTIFSKSYYRSSNMNHLSHSQMYDKQEIEDHLLKIKSEIEVSSANIENEQERTHSIQNQLDQLFKTKQKIKAALGELESLTEAADKRFDNLQRIQFLANEKESMTFKSLNKIKSELGDQELMRQNILSRQEEKREKEHYDRKEIEESTGNILIKIDEQDKLYNQSKQELQVVLNQERKIIKKRNQSKYILKYIEFFDTFKDIFMGKQIKEDIIKALYDAQDLANMNENKHLDDIVKENNTEADVRSNYTLSSNMITPRNMDEAIAPHVQSYYQSRFSPNKSMKDSARDLENKENEYQTAQDQETVERTDLINKINEFLDLYPEGLETCIEDVLRILNKMRYQQETNNEKYEILLKAKTQKTQDYLDLESKLEELEKNNPYVELMRQNAAEETRIENIQEAFDAGYVKVNLPKYPLISASAHGEELAHKLSLYTTVNILKLSDMTDFGRVVEEIKYNKNFFLNFFMNYGDSIMRMCKIVKTIYKKILQNVPSPLMNKRCQETIKYIQSIWMENEKNKEVVETMSNIPELTVQNQASNISNANTLQISQVSSQGNKTNTNKVRLSIETIQAEQLEILHQQQLEKEQKKHKKFKIIVEKFSEEEIADLFNTVFGKGFDQEAKIFFEEIKNDRLVWFFCNIDIIQDFLNSKYSLNQNNSKKAVEDLMMHFVDLEDYASQEYNHRLNDLYNHFVGLMNQIKQENQEIIDDLGEKNIIYRPNRVFKTNEIQTNPKIALAIENAIKRQNEYLFSASDNLISKEENEATSPTNNHHLHHHHSQMNNRNILEENMSRLTGTKDGQRLQQIIDYISNVPSSRQREAAKRKYLIPQTYGIKNQINGGAILSGQNTLSTSNAYNFGNQSSQQEHLPLQMVHASSQLSQQSQQQQQQQLQQNNQSQANQMIQTASTIQNNNTQSSAQALDSSTTQRIIAISQGGNPAGGILKKKASQRKTLDYKSIQDVMEDNFIDDEARKQKLREKQEHLEYLLKEKEKNKKLLQIEKEKEPNAQFKIIQDLNQRLTHSTSNQNMHSKTLRQFSKNQKILSKIDRLDRNYDPSTLSALLFNEIEHEKKQIFKNMVQQDQEEEDQKQPKNEYKIQITSNKNDIDDEEEEDDDVNFEKHSDHHDAANRHNLKLVKASQSYLKSTTSMESRKKAAQETLLQLKSDRQKNQLLHKQLSLEKEMMPPSQHQVVREKGKSSEKNRSTLRSWKTNVSTATHSKRPDTQQQFSSTSQFYQSQNQKFFSKYNDNQDERMPNINEKGYKKSSLDKRKIHSSKSSGDILNKNFKHKANQNAASKNQQQKQNDQQYSYRIPQTSDAKFNTEFRSGNYDRANFYDFPFFSHPMSVQNNSYNIPMFPLMNPPNLNLYTPTGLLTNYTKPSENINIINSQMYY